MRWTVTPPSSRVSRSAPGAAAHDSTWTAWPRPTSRRALFHVCTPTPPRTVSGGYSCETRQIRMTLQRLRAAQFEDDQPLVLQQGTAARAQAGVQSRVILQPPERGPRKGDEARSGGAEP